MEKSIVSPRRAIWFKSCAGHENKTSQTDEILCIRLCSRLLKVGATGSCKQSQTVRSNTSKTRVTDGDEVRGDSRDGGDGDDGVTVVTAVMAVMAHQRVLR